MPFNTTQQERDKNVRRDHAEKLKFERSMKRDIRTFLNRVLVDFKSTYLLTARLQDFSIYQDDIRSLLRNTYLEVSASFSEKIREGLIANAINEGDEEITDFFQSEEALVLAATINQDIRAFINEQVEISSRSILNTTQNDLSKSLANSIVENVGEFGVIGAFSTSSERAKIVNDASADFKDTFEGRQDTIAMSEVENASEGSKFIEAIALAVIPVVQVIDKIWNTIIDGLQRESHDAADQQRVPVNQPFIVQGQALNFPRDSSLGASLDNLINCRCSVSYVVL